MLITVRSIFSRYRPCCMSELTPASAVAERLHELKSRGPEFLSRAFADVNQVLHPWTNPTSLRRSWQVSRTLTTAPRLLCSLPQLSATRIGSNCCAPS